MITETKARKIEEIAVRFETEAARMRREADERDRKARAWRKLLKTDAAAAVQETQVVAA